MKIKLSQIRDGKYQIGNGKLHKNIMIERSDIKKSLANYKPEKRSFQPDIGSLNNDFAGKSFDEAYEISKNSHVRRVATIIKEQLYLQPILIYRHSKPIDDYLDGGHRVIAARYLGLEEIDAIQVDKELSEEEKQQLWDKITELNNDVIGALTSLGIPYTP